MPYGSAHTSDLPVVSTTLGPDYAEQINAAIEELRTTVDARVTPAGMQMNDDLSFLESGTYSGIVDLERVEFQNQAEPMSAGAAPGSLFVSDGELYYNDVSGNQIQVTDSGALNIAVSGGITGSGYGSSGVEVNWSSGSSAYLMKSGAGGNDYAHVWCNDLLLNDGSGNYWTLASPALATDLTLTLPAAYPGSTAIMQMSAAGVVSASNTVANAVSMSSTLGVTGLITATAGVTAGVDTDVTISGTGRFKHGSLVKILNGMSGLNGPSGTWVVQDADAGAGVAFEATHTAGDTTFWIVPINLDVGERVQQIDARVFGHTADTLTMSVWADVNGVGVQQGSNQTSGTTATYQPLTETTSFTVVSGATFFIVFAPTGGGGELRVSRIQITYDRP